MTPLVLRGRIRLTDAAVGLACTLTFSACTVVLRRATVTTEPALEPGSPVGPSFMVSCLDGHTLHPEPLLPQGHIRITPCPSHRQDQGKPRMCKDFVKCKCFQLLINTPILSAAGSPNRGIKAGALVTTCCPERPSHSRQPTASSSC